MLSASQLRFLAAHPVGRLATADRDGAPHVVPVCFAVVGAPSYFEQRKRPTTPRDLTGHSCIKLRLPTHGGFYAWEFYKGRQVLKVRIEGRAAFSTLGMMRQAA